MSLQRLLRGHLVWTLTPKGSSADITDDLASQIFVNWAAINKSKRDSSASALADEDIDSVHYWVYSPGDNASKWDEFYNKGIMGIGWDEIGDLKEFASKDDMKQKMNEYYGAELSHKNSAHATWQFAKGSAPPVNHDSNQLCTPGTASS